VLGFRPEALELADEGMPAYVEVVEELGADAFVFCSRSSKTVPRTRGWSREQRRGSSPAQGDRVTLKVRPDEAHVFDVGERRAARID
jgi:multiple sugar transport system ATP-binding protein